MNDEIQDSQDSQDSLEDLSAHNHEQETAMTPHTDPAAPESGLSEPEASESEEPESGAAEPEAAEPEAVDSGAPEPALLVEEPAGEIRPVIECLLFVAEEPLPFKQICKVLGTVPEEEVSIALNDLIAEYEQRGSGLEIREVAGGWRISTRPQHHDFIRKYLKTRPSARLSLPALETLAVIAYKQPITIPEILDIRGVSSSSAIKTLLEKRLIVTKGRKETVGRPMMYGTSREFLIQFGLRDLGELPSMEDFEDLAQ
jgi:segregation and condensation protein B